MRSMVLTLAAALVGCALYAPAANALSLSVTTFNIRFYGQSDKESAMNGLRDRDQWIRQFLAEADFNTDVYVFEEIVDINRLERQILQNNYRCVSYDENNLGHQHVVICFKPQFRFVKAADDNNYLIDDVALGGRLRPAVHGILQTSSGRDLLHIVGVHLKAYPDETETRLLQTQMIAEYLGEQTDGVPFLITGDFNSFYDDPERMSDTYYDYGLDIDQVENPYDYTFRTTRYRDKLDRFWLSNDVYVISAPVVAGPCNNESNNQGQQLENIPFYNSNVSDHCPVNIVLDL